MFPIINKASHCLDCYRCLRGCAVKTISFKSGQAKINTEKCVLCGRCVQECPQKIKTLVDKSMALTTLLAEQVVVLVVAPTFAVHFNQWSAQETLAKFKRLGFLAVEEIAQFGETLYQSYEQDQDSEGYTISSHCPVVVNMIEQYFPDLLGRLQLSSYLPDSCGQWAKARYGAEVKVVYATSCLAEMEQEGLYDHVDLIIPFSQLAGLLPLETDVTAEDILPQYALIGQELAIAGGLSNHLVKAGRWSLDQVQHYSGIKDCWEVLQGLSKRGNPEKGFIELMACRGGCINGLDLVNKGTLLEKRADLMERANQWRQLPTALPLPASQVMAPIERYYQPPVVDNHRVKEILAELLQYSKKRVLNCGVCGYDTCYQKAVAVASGEAELEMCMSYIKAKALSMSHTIVRSNPSAIIVFDQDFMIHEFNNAAREMFAKYGLRVGNALFEYIDIRHIEKVVETGIGVRDKVIHYPDLDLWTRQIVVQMYDTRNFYLAIFTDITEQEKKRMELEQMRHETLTRANQVINNQMLVAQQIAGLLGETTAETKITLLELTKQFTQEKELE